MLKKKCIFTLKPEVRAVDGTKDEPCLKTMSSEWQPSVRAQQFRETIMVKIDDDDHGFIDNSRECQTVVPSCTVVDP